MAVADIPLPRVVADVGPGGPFVTAARGWNALRGDQLQNEIKRVQAQYAPLTTQAEAASKLAYSNLMGPQFISKMMANPDIVANLPEDQRRAMLNMIYQSGMGQRTGNAILSGIPQNQSGQTLPQNSNPFMQLLRNVAPGVGDIVGDIGNIFGMGGQTPSVSQQQSPQQMQSPIMPPAQQNPLMRPGEYSVVQPDGTLGQPTQAWQQANTQQVPRDETYFEKAGRESGVKKEREELGGIRAKAIDEMDQQYQQAVQAGVPIQHLMDISQNPTFMNMRSKIPFFQDQQLKMLAKTGTPEEQKIIGDFISTTTQAVANTVNSFGGRALVKEFDVGERMKISPNDTWNAMIGKLGSIESFNEMTKQRSRIASQLMQKEHLNRGDALERADKMVDGKAIRQKIENSLSPKPTDEDINYMAQKYNKSPEEIKKQLKEKGLI